MGGSVLNFKLYTVRKLLNIDFFYKYYPHNFKLDRRVACTAVWFMHQYRDYSVRDVVSGVCNACADTTVHPVAPRTSRHCVPLAAGGSFVLLALISC